WSKFPLKPPLTTDKIRVLVRNSLSGYSRVVEIEAYESTSGKRNNVALATNGGTASASSTPQPGPARLAIDGDRSVSRWVGQQPFAFPGWLQVDFNGVKTINQIDLYLGRDILQVLTDFDVQYWGDSGWVTVTGGSVSGNRASWRKFSFANIT